MAEKAHDMGSAKLIKKGGKNECKYSLLSFCFKSEQLDVLPAGWINGYISNVLFH